MAYAFKQIEAHDPNNPGLVAPNASVTIFEPGDPTKTPLTLTTLAGDPLPNPVTVNGMGYGPAFMHATLSQVAWSGGGLTGTFESYEGMRDEAIAARTAAETAAATAGADAAAVADAAIGDATAEAEAAAASAAAAEAAASTAATAAANSAALVGAPADTAIAAAISGTGTTNAALKAVVRALATVVDARDYPSAQAAIDAAPPLAAVWFDPRTAWTLTDDLKITKPLTIRGENTLIEQTGTGKAGFTVTSSNTHFNGLDVLGRQSATLNGAETAINFVGASATNRLTGTSVRNTRIRRWGYAGVFGSYISGFEWDKLTIGDIGYMGAGTASGEFGKFSNSTIDTITQATGATNSYGVAFSHNETLDQTAAPRSRDIECNNVRVSNVPLWEGFDTHGGLNISFINCQAYNCRTAFAMVPARTGTGVYNLAPKGFQIQGCTMDSGRTDGAFTVGITAVGCSTGTGFHNNIDYATGIISGNIVKNYGNQAASSGCALNLQDTSGVVVSTNVFNESAVAAIRLDYNNKDAVITANTATDVWSNTVAVAAMINTMSAWNTFKAMANVLIRGTKTATTVNAQGLRLGSALATMCVESGNDFSAATTPYTGANGLIRHDRRGIQDGFVTALPGLGVWQRSAQALSTVPTASTSPGWVCVTAGGATSATWAASTAYTTATWAKTSTGKVLECITAGTSGTVEPDPATVGGLVTDGTAVWIYRSPTTAVFKALPALAA